MPCPAREAGATGTTDANSALQPIDVARQIAGAYYGIDGIPGHWRDRLVMVAEIQQLADDLYTLSESAISQKE
jgi:ADP-ribosylglycohydrolase